MTSTLNKELKYVDKVRAAIGKATTLSECEYIEDKINKSPKMPNRRTKLGREIRDKLLALLNKKAQEIINKGEQPF